MHHANGTHILLDFHVCAHLCDAEKLTDILCAAARAGGATVIDHRFHTFPGRAGVTGVVLLAESHISIHTWPETQFAALDIFMCGDCAPEKAAAYLETALKPERITRTELSRGGD